jgi:hypothetical protein
MSGIRSVNSRDSRRKLRRWGFSAVFNKTEGGSVGKNMPGVVYGDYTEAQSVAARLVAIFKEKNPEVDVEVRPIPYETVSIETKRQFEGLNDQASLVTKAAFILADKYRLSVGIIDKDVAQIVNEAVEEARESLFPRLQQAQEKMRALKESVNSKAPATEEPVPAEPEVKDRKRGIEAVREALEGTGVDEASIVHLEDPLEEAA